MFVKPPGSVFTMTFAISIKVTDLAELIIGCRDQQSQKMKRVSDRVKISRSFNFSFIITCYLKFSAEDKIKSGSLVFNKNKKVIK